MHVLLISVLKGFNINQGSKFKVSDFDKYQGTTCPKNHLKMYYQKMGAYAKDEKLLMHFF